MKTAFSLIKNIFQSDYLKIFAIFTFFFFCFSLIYFTLDRFPSLDDPFFHIRFAEIFKEKGLDAFTDFKWLYHSKIAQEGAYPVYFNLLFYVVLIPFTFVSPLFLGIKLYGVFAASLIFTLLYYFLRRIGAKPAFLWTLGVFAIIGPSSIWRFLMTRPFTLAPVLLLILLYFLWKRNYLAVFLLSFAYLFWHSATFPFPLFVTLVYVVFLAFYRFKFDWRLVLGSLAGTIAALFVVQFFLPGFLLYIKEIVVEIFSETVLGNKVVIAEGNELYAASFFDFLRSNFLILILLIVSTAVEIYRYIDYRRKFSLGEVSPTDKDVLRGALFFLSLVFLLGTFFSRRNADFFVFFAGPYAVMGIGYIFSSLRVTASGVKKALVAGLSVAILYLTAGNFFSVHQMIASSGSYNNIEPAAEWLKKNTKPGEVIFHPTWNWFTTLFYYNPNNYYIAGLEPRFLYTYSPALYWQWIHISEHGYLCAAEKCPDQEAKQQFALRKSERQKNWYQNEGELVADIVLNSFKSRYIITARPYVMLNRLLDNHIRFKKVFDDNNYFMIYEVLPR